ncbi:OmpA family protein [Neisseria montereyensis]|uniref:OmpA family protein n=1 Tax=Neisseria montereyensis TaxID=2973938 RepID=A0ABT2FEP7_9NEIS|nr:OmpA family protein [Neisseria montereyensis]MCS4534662.1 OmpA family protein [Neisseria montereyensis]
MMNLKTVSGILIPMFLLSACSPQEITESESSQEIPTNAEISTDAEMPTNPSISMDEDMPTDAEIRAAERAPLPSKLSARASKLSGNVVNMNANQDGMNGGNNGLNSGGSQLHGNVTGISTKETEKGVEVNMSSDVLFDFDKADLKPDATAVLQQAAAIINEQGTGKITITGHTDSKGEEDYNIKLSVARAQSVKDWLAKNGVTKDMEVEGKGESLPIADNENADGSDNPEGRAQNRRVEIVIAKQQPTQ